MEKLKAKANEAAARWVRKIGLVAMEKWPPDCFGPYYQPPRPARVGQEQPPAEARNKARR